MTPEQIRSLRQQLGLSQRELAERLNAIDPSLRTGPTTVNRWERGRYRPSAHAIAALRQLAEAPRPTGDRLSTTLLDAATIAEQEAQAAIGDGDPEYAETALGIARQLRRLASNHRGRAILTEDRDAHDPRQLA